MPSYEKEAALMLNEDDGELNLFPESVLPPGTVDDIPDFNTPDCFQLSLGVEARKAAARIRKKSKKVFGDVKE